MILLDGHSLTQAGWIGDVNENLIIKERDSTAAWTPQTLEGIGIDSWLLDETKPGSGIVWRIQNFRQTFSTGQLAVNLEHVINTLKDKIIHNEIGPAQITGTPGATTCTAEQAVRYILSLQNDWTLGSFDYASVSNPYKFNGETLYEGLEKVSDTLEDAWWSYNTSVYPFVINITQKQTGVGTELRANRNLITIDKTIEKGGMYTRFYPVGKNDLRITGDYREKNTQYYGVKEKEEVDQSLTTEAELIAWADERLNKHAEPIVTVVVDSLELADATGEDLDRIQLGMYCQIPLPEFGTTIRERITEKNYPDAKNSPEVVKITLANNREDVTKILADAIKSGGKSRRTAAKKDKEDHAWFEDTDNHVAMVAEGIVGVDAQGNPNWVRLSEIIVDENGIDQSVKSVQNGLLLAEGRLTVNEDAITAEVTRATGAEGSLSGAINVEAGKINQVVTAVGANGEVTAASICLAINQSGESSAVIDASKIYLLGQTIADTITANYIANKIAAIGTLNTNTILAGAINVVVGQTTSPVATETYVRGCPWDLRITQSGNTYTLQQKRLGYEAVWTDVGSFSRATTLSAGWDGNRKFTVGASPQGVERYTTLVSAVPNANVTWNGTTATLALKATVDDGETTVNVGDITVNVANYLQDKTGTAKITTNGTYSPDTGYIGFSEIEVDVAGGGGGGTTTLSNTWSSGHLVVNASPQGVTLERWLSGAGTSWSGNVATVPINALWGNSQQYSESTGWSVSVDASSKINAASAAVTLNDPTWNTVSSIGDNRTATVTTSGRTDSSGTTDNLSKSVALYLTQGSWSSDNKMEVSMRNGSDSGTVVAKSVVDAGTRVTNAGYAGRAAVTLVDPTWNAVTGTTPANRTVTVSTTGRTNSSGTTDNLSKSVALYLTQGSWSSNKKTVFMRTISTRGTVYAQTEVDASSLVTSAGYAGRAAVTISDTLSWAITPATGIATNQNAVTVSTTGRTNSSGTTANSTKTINFYSQTGSWGTPSANKCYVYVTHTDSTNAHRIIRREVDATSIYNNGYDANNTSWLYEQSTGSIAGNLNPGIWVTAGYRDHNNTVHYCGSRWYTLKAGGVRAYSGAEPSGIQTLAASTVYEIYYDNGSGGTPGSGKYFKTPSSGTSYSHSASLYCYEISTGGTGVKTVRFSVQYSASQSVPFSTGRSYSMHW